MASTWCAEEFPRFEQSVRKLAQQHRELKDEPLYLALCYGAARAPHDIFLLEVIGHGLEEIVSPERELFETTFTPTPGFPMDLDQRLHLILTNPEEFAVAVRDRWPSATEIIDVVHAGDYQVLHANKIGKRLLNNIIQQKNGAGGG